MNYKNNDQLREWLKPFPDLVEEDVFPLNAEEFAHHLGMVKRRPVGEQEDAAAFRCLTWGREMPKPAPITSSGTTVVMQAPMNLQPVTDCINKWGKRILWALALIAMLLAASNLHAQNNNPAIVVATCGTPPVPYPVAGQRAPVTVDVNGNECAGVSVSATVSTAGLAITFGATTAGGPGYPAAVYSTSATPSYTNGTFNALSSDLSGNLRVNAAVTVPGSLQVSTSLGGGSGAVTVIGAASDGTTATFSPVQIGGKDDGGLVQALRTTAAGNTVVSLETTSGNIGTVTVTDGAGALNVIVDSGTITGITNAVTINTAATGAVTITDGAGALNTIVDSGTLTAVTSITNTVTVQGTTGGVAVTIAGTSGGSITTLPINQNGVRTGSQICNSAGDACATITSNKLDVNATVTPAANATVDINRVLGQPAATNGNGVLAVAGAASAGLVVQGSTTGAPVQVNFLTSSISVTCTSGCSASAGVDITSINSQPVATNGNGVLAVAGAASSGLITDLRTINGAPMAATTAGILPVVLATTAGNIGTVTVTDGAGALNVIVDSGVITSIGSTVNVQGVTGGVAVTVAGATGGSIKTMATDASGRVIVAGTAPSGGLTQGDPVVVGATTGGRSYNIVSDTTGRQVVVGAAPTGGTTQGDPVVTGVTSGGRSYNIAGDTTGRLVITGAAPTGGVTQGAPVLVAGATGSNTFQIATDTSGRQIMTGATPTGGQTQGNPVLTGGATGGVTVSIAADTSGRLIVASPSIDGLYISVSITTDTTIITGTANTYTYLTSIAIWPMGTATNVALVSGTGTNCGTGTAGLAGGTTAATGGNFGANGGIVLGSGIAPVIRSKVPGDNICLKLSAANQVSGSMTGYKQ